MSVEISKAGAEAVERLRGLWLELHHHHQSVQPGWEYKGDEASWEARREAYLRRLAGDGSFVLLAEDAGELVGYLLVEVKTEPDDTWTGDDRFAHVHSLSIVPAGRGQGLGTRLLDRMEEELAADGVEDIWIDALTGNEQAIKLYERRGFRPAVVYLAKLGKAEPGKAKPGKAELRTKA
ncbi:GNAT family N-acetyltransferase [Actinocorallia longicatena]|uniref:N-acetyltransferase domain-containing protein n=1 Tax=Actinocorallia longicatena TaxID=111803 RepID=A0ABP6QAW4_9ACTN